MCNASQADEKAELCVCVGGVLRNLTLRPLRRPRCHTLMMALRWFCFGCCPPNMLQYGNTASLVYPLLLQSTGLGQVKLLLPGLIDMPNRRCCGRRP